MNISVVIVLLFYLIQNVFNTWSTFTSSQHIRLIVVVVFVIILWPGLPILLFAVNDLYILQAVLPFQIAIELGLGRRSPLIINIDNSLRSLFLYLYFLHQIHILLLLLFLCHFGLIILLHFLVQSLWWILILAWGHLSGWRLLCGPAIRIAWIQTVGIDVGPYKRLLIITRSFVILGLRKDIQLAGARNCWTLVNRWERQTRKQKRAVASTLSSWSTSLVYQLPG